MAKIAKHKINFAEKNLKKKKERIEKMNMKTIGFMYMRSNDIRLPDVARHILGEL